MIEFYNIYRINGLVLTTFCLGFVCLLCLWTYITAINKVERRGALTYLVIAGIGFVIGLVRIHSAVF